MHLTSTPSLPRMALMSICSSNLWRIYLLSLPGDVAAKGSVRLRLTTRSHKEFVSSRIMQWLKKSFVIICMWIYTDNVLLVIAHVWVLNQKRKWLLNASKLNRPDPRHVRERLICGRSWMAFIFGIPVHNNYGVADPWARSRTQTKRGLYSKISVSPGAF